MPASPVKRYKTGKAMTPVHSREDDTLKDLYLTGKVIPQRVAIPKNIAARREKYHRSIGFTTIKPNGDNTYNIRPGVALQEALDPGYAKNYLDNACVSLDLPPAVDICVQWPNRSLGTSLSQSVTIQQPRNEAYWTRLDLAYAIARSMRSWKQAKEADEERVHEFLLNTVLLEVRQFAPKGWQPVFMEDENLSAFLRKPPTILAGPSSWPSHGRMLMVAPEMCGSPDSELSS